MLMTLFYAISNRDLVCQVFFFVARSSHEQMVHLAGTAEYIDSISAEG